jgi:hypothetical protein
MATAAGLDIHAALAEMHCFIVQFYCAYDFQYDYEICK